MGELDVSQLMTVAQAMAAIDAAPVALRVTRLSLSSADGPAAGAGGRRRPRLPALRQEHDGRLRRPRRGRGENPGGIAGGGADRGGARWTEP